jgi:hypothetical protein
MLWNIVVSCMSCNRRKGHRTGWEFVSDPTEEQRRRFVLIDRLTRRKRLGWWERIKLRRGVKRRHRDGARKRSRQAHLKYKMKREVALESAMSSDLYRAPSADGVAISEIPVDVGASPGEKYRQRFAVLHRRYGSALPKDVLEELWDLYYQDRARG